MIGSAGEITVGYTVSLLYYDETENRNSNDRNSFCDKHKLIDRFA